MNEITKPKNTNDQLLVRFRIPRKVVEIPVDGESSARTSARGHEVSKSGDSSAVRKSAAAETVRSQSAAGEEEE